MISLQVPHSSLASINCGYYNFFVHIFIVHLIAQDFLFEIYLVCCMFLSLFFFHFPVDGIIVKCIRIKEYFSVALGLMRGGNKRDPEQSECGLMLKSSAIVIVACHI